MTITIHLGVVDVPYAVHVAEPQRRVGVKARKGQAPEAFSAPPGGGETTGDVATYLEDKYHIMEVFWEDVGEDLIAKAFERGLEKAMQNLAMGQPPDLSDPFIAATTELEAAFDLFLTQQEMDGVVGGVPTKAALAGVNHSFKHPYAKGNPERPSFIDTGTYRSHFKVWVTTEG